MLDKEDLQAISGIVKSEVTAAIEKNNPILLEEVDKRIHKAVDESSQKVIQAVGEMLEDNVFPQFAEIHSELRKLKIVAGWQT